MIVIICVDDKLGMAFNHRRQSMDDTLRRKILEFCGDHKIWMRAYTAKQFGQYDNATNLIADEDYLSKAAAEDYAMVETDSILPFASDIQGLVLCRWNRTYPADTFLEVPGNITDWEISVIDEFAGSSHPKITMEYWRRTK